MTRPDLKPLARELVEDIWNSFGPEAAPKRVRLALAALERVAAQERAECLDWIASERRDCGCADRIAAKIHFGEEGA